MILYILMLILIGILIFLNLKYYKFDILSPSLLYNISMFISIVCSMIGLSSWNSQASLDISTCLIVIFSVLFFNVGEFCIRFYIYKFSKKKNINLIDNRKKFPIEVSNVATWKIVLELIFVFIVLLLVFSEVYRIAIVAGYKSGGLGAMIKVYRSTSILFSTKYIEAGVGINIIVAQLQKIMEVICYVNLYYIANIFFVKKIVWRKYILYLLIVLFSFVSSLLTGSRMQLLIYIVFFVVVLIFKLSNKYNYKEIIEKFWKKIIVGCLIVVSLFYIILPLTGRKSEVSFIDYITFYFGAPIPTLNIFINEPIDEPKVFGEETFRGIQNVLYKLKLSDYIQPISKEWEFFYTEDNQKLSSNIYTSGKRYFFDFGFAGVIILQFVNGAVMYSLYLLAMSKKNMVFVIFFAMYAYTIIDQVRDEYLFSTFVHINTVFKFVVLCVGAYFLKYSIKWSGNNEVKN